MINTVKNYPANVELEKLCTRLNKRFSGITFIDREDNYQATCKKVEIFLNKCYGIFENKYGIFEIYHITRCGA